MSEGFEFRNTIFVCWQHPLQKYSDARSNQADFSEIITHSDSDSDSDCLSVYGKFANAINYEHKKKLSFDFTKNTESSMQLKSSAQKIDENSTNPAILWLEKSVEMNQEKNRTSDHENEMMLLMCMQMGLF